jgi:hypothetical protein
MFKRLAVAGAIIVTPIILAFYTTLPVSADMVTTIGAGANATCIKWLGKHDNEHPGGRSQTTPDATPFDDQQQKVPAATGCRINNNNLIAARIAALVEHTHVYPIYNNMS